MLGISDDVFYLTRFRGVPPGSTSPGSSYLEVTILGVGVKADVKRL